MCLPFIISRLIDDHSLISSAYVEGHLPTRYRYKRIVDISDPLSDFLLTKDIPVLPLQI